MGGNCLGKKGGVANCLGKKGGVAGRKGGVAGTKLGETAERWGKAEVVPADKEGAAGPPPSTKASMLL